MTVTNDPFMSMKTVEISRAATALERIATVVTAFADGQLVLEQAYPNTNSWVISRKTREDA